VYLASALRGPWWRSWCHLGLDPQRLPLRYKMLKADAPMTLARRINASSLLIIGRDDLTLTRKLATSG